MAHYLYFGTVSGDSELHDDGAVSEDDPQTLLHAFRAGGMHGEQIGIQKLKI